MKAKDIFKNPTEYEYIKRLIERFNGKIVYIEDFKGHRIYFKKT